MLDQLVESRNNSQQNRRSLTFFLVIGCIILTILGSAWLRSLFAKELGIGGEDLELSSLVAPVPVPEAEPPKPEPIKQEEKQQTSKSTVAVLKEAPVQTLDTPPKDPPKIQTTKSTAVTADKVRDYRIDPNAGNNFIPSAPSGRGTDTGGGGGGGGTGMGKPKEVPPPVDKDDPPPVNTPKPTPPPTPPPTPKPTPPPPPKIVSGGVVNGKAVSLVKPAYPPAAKAVGAKGSVSVSVVIDENGNVISASAAGGHPLLQPAAVAAARSSKFSPTMLSGQKVKVSGVIVYNFQ